MVNVKIQRVGGGGMPKKQKGPRKSTAKEVSLKVLHLVFCALKMVIAVDRLLLHFVMRIKIEKGGGRFSLQARSCAAKSLT